MFGYLDRFGYEDDDYELVGGEWSLTLNDGTEQFRNVTALLVNIVNVNVDDKFNMKYMEFKGTCRLR